MLWERGDPLRPQSLLLQTCDIAVPLSLLCAWVLRLPWGICWRGRALTCCVEAASCCVVACGGRVPLSAVMCTLYGAAACCRLASWGYRFIYLLKECLLRVPQPISAMGFFIEGFNPSSFCYLVLCKVFFDKFLGWEGFGFLVVSFVSITLTLVARKFLQPWHIRSFVDPGTEPLSEHNNWNYPFCGCCDFLWGRLLYQVCFPLAFLMLNLILLEICLGSFKQSFNTVLLRSFVVSNELFYDLNI
jgi:hypothetical protein